jgi:hypothetical protein
MGQMASGIGMGYILFIFHVNILIELLKIQKI